MNKKDINLNVENNTLTISGERKFEKEEDNKQYHRVESHFGSFSRSFALPENVDYDSISASYKTGILTITVDKSEKNLKKQIEIK
jgi:HSP20 family protein